MKAIQLRMARAAVGWGVRELAKKAGITANTVTRIENGADAKQSTMDRLQRALEVAGLSSPMVTSLASALLGLLPHESAPAVQNEALPPKHAAKPPRRPRRNDRYRAARGVRRPLRCLDGRLSWPASSSSTRTAGVQG